jgi:hypothetical protein
VRKTVWQRMWPLRTILLHWSQWEADKGKSTGRGTETDPPTQQQKTAGKGTERPPPIILTTTLNLLKFQAEIKAITSGNFEFHNTRNGIRVMVRGMADYWAILRHLDAQKLLY